MIEDSQLVPLLLESGLVDHVRIRQGVKLGREQGLSLYEALAQFELMDERALVRIIAQKLNVPTVELSRVDITAELLALIPSSMATRNKVVPIQIREERGQRHLVLGMADPLDVVAMDEIATHTGIDIRPVLVGPSELTEFLKTGYARQDDVVDDLLDDLDGIAADLLSEDGDWEEFFDDAQAVAFTDTASISQEMRDRPASADVFGDDSAADPLEDLGDLNDPDHQSEPMLDLEDEWELDDAITGRQEDDPLTSPSQRAEILSAAAANSLFADVLGDGDFLAGKDGEDDETQTSDSTEVGVKGKSSSASAAGGMAVRKGQRSKGGGGDSKTQAGMGIAEMAQGLHDEDDTTGIKQDPERSGIRKGKRGGKRSDGTDWGALGREILIKSVNDEKSDDDDFELEAPQRKLPEDDPDTRALHEETVARVYAEDEGDKTIIPASMMGGDPLTREMGDADLADLAGELGGEETAAAGLHESTAIAGLGERTAAADTVQQAKLVSQAGADRGTQVGSPAALADLISEVEDSQEFKIPKGVTEHGLLMAALKILIARDLLDPDTLIELAKQESKKSK